MGMTRQINPNQVIVYYREHGLELVKTLGETDRLAFKDLIEKYHDLPFAEFHDKIQDSVVASEGRAKTIYTTEKHNAMTVGYDQYVEKYVDETGKQIWKTWHHGDSIEPRPEHLRCHGETVRFEENFSNGLRIPEGINCSCWLTYSDEKPQ